jgi:XRE family transcriptional regulator, regulator of sulfur utilization
MEPTRVTDYIGRILRQLRLRRNWTLDDLSNATGVSKPMLGQIERGETNPTVVTLWKIVGGLDVPFSTFLHGLEPTNAVLKKFEEQVTVTDDEGRYSVRSTLALQSGSATDLFTATLQPYSTHVAESHGAGVREGLVVLNGRLTVAIGDHQHPLNTGDSITFTASEDHSYINETDSVCEFLVLLTYDSGSGAAGRY